jgi:hypothetical protein
MKNTNQLNEAIEYAEKNIPVIFKLRNTFGAFFKQADRERLRALISEYRALKRERLSRNSPLCPMVMLGEN